MALLFARWHGIRSGGNDELGNLLGDTWGYMSASAKWIDGVKVISIFSRKGKGNVFNSSGNPDKIVKLKKGDWLIVDLETKRFYQDLSYLEK